MNVCVTEFLRDHARKTVCRQRPICSMLTVMPHRMTDLEALELLRSDIRKLFPLGPVRDRWLAWAAQLADERRAYPPTKRNVKQGKARMVLRRL
jgi:hypothetical protein